MSCNIIHLLTGDSVPTDIRLVTTISLKADQTMLTGESLLVFENADTILKSKKGRHVSLSC